MLALKAPWGYELCSSLRAASSAAGGSNMGTKLPLVHGFTISRV